MYLAKQLDGILLTGDGKLAKFASADSIEVHGILYVLRLMVDYNIASSDKIADKLKELLEINKRLPVDICEKLIEEWNN